MTDELHLSYSPSLFSGSSAVPNVGRAVYRFKARFPQYIWNESVADGRAYTLPQVRTILDGQTEGGSRLADFNDILNQQRSLDALIRLVTRGAFDLSKSTFCSLHDVAAKEDALIWGAFRTGQVSVAGASYAPPPAAQLDAIFESGICYLAALSNPVERGIMFFLFGAYHQFFFDVNKRTARLTMNGVLLATGQDALVIDAHRRDEYDAALIQLYNRKDAHPAIRFMLDCDRLQDATLRDEGPTRGR